jgi:hypothetical protein
MKRLVAASCIVLVGCSEFSAVVGEREQSRWLWRGARRPEQQRGLRRGPRLACILSSILLHAAHRFHAPAREAEIGAEGAAGGLT